MVEQVIRGETSNTVLKKKTRLESTEEESTKEMKTIIKMTAGTADLKKKFKTKYLSYLKLSKFASNILPNL